MCFGVFFVIGRGGGVIGRFLERVGVVWVRLGVIGCKEDCRFG